MSITRSKIARQMYANGALVDPRMANTLEQNRLINDANAQINQAMRSPGGLKSLYDQYGISDADRSRLSGGMASRNRDMVLSNRGELAKQLAGLQNQNVVYSSGPSAEDIKRQQREDALRQKIENNQKIVAEYLNNNYGLGQTISVPPVGTTPSQSLPASPYYQQQDLINKLTPLTFSEVAGEETFDTLSDYDQYNMSQIFPEYQSQLRNSSYTPSVLMQEPDIFDKKYGLSHYLSTYKGGLPYAKGGRAGFAYGGDTGGYDEAGISTPSSSFDFGGPSVGGGGGNDETRYLPTTAQLDKLTPTSSFDTNVNNITRGIRGAGAINNLVKTVGAKGLMSFPAALAVLEAYNALKGNDQTVGYAKGGRTGFAYGGSYDEAGVSFGGPSGGGITSADLGGGPSFGGDSGGYDDVRLPTTAEIEKAVQPSTVPDTTVKYFPDYGIVKSVARKATPTLAKGIGYGAGLIPGYVLGKIIDAEQEKEQKAKADLTNAALTGSFYVPSEGRLSKDLIANSDALLGFSPRTTGPTTPTFTGGDNEPIIPRLPAQTPTDVESEPSDFDLYAALEGREALRFGENPYGYMGAMQRFAEGGRVRRGYGLGGIIKSVGKAVKKVLKSDVGKAAIGLASLYYGPKLFGEPKGFTSWKNVNFLKSMKDNPLPWILGGSTLAGLASSQEEEDDLDQISDRKDTSGLRELMAGYPALRFQVPKQYQLAANGGRIGYAEGGLMDLGGMEKDYRAEGGFVPIGAEEKADDVPARLSKNEFVFTADAVRSAGDGDIDKGAEVMYNVMKNLESGGKISDESQGLQGARDMFQTSQRLGEIL